jgi:hypothetical protein
VLLKGEGTFVHESTLASFSGKRRRVGIFVGNIPEDEEFDEGADENHYGELA